MSSNAQIAVSAPSVPRPCVVVLTEDADRGDQVEAALPQADVVISASVEGARLPRSAPDLVLVDGPLLRREGLPLIGDLRQTHLDAPLAVLGTEDDALALGTRLGRTGRLPWVAPDDPADLAKTLQRLLAPRTLLRLEVSGTCRLVTSEGPRELALVDLSETGLALHVPTNERLGGLLPTCVLSDLRVTSDSGELLLTTAAAMVRHVNVDRRRGGFLVGVRFGAEQARQDFESFPQRLALIRRAIGTGETFMVRAPGEPESAFALESPSLARIGGLLHLVGTNAAAAGLIAGDAVEVQFGTGEATFRFYSSLRSTRPAEIAFPRVLVEERRRRHGRAPLPGAAPTVRLHSPLQGVLPPREALDLDAGGLSVAVRPESELLPAGLMLPVIEIELGSGSVVRSRGRVTHVSPLPRADGERRVRAGIELLDVSREDHERLARALLTRRWEDVDAAREADHDAIWAFLKEAAFTFHEYTDEDAASTTLAREKHRLALGDGTNPVWRTLLIRDSERIYGHATGMKTFPRTWLHFQIAAVRGPFPTHYVSSALLVGLNDHLLDQPDTDFVQGYWRTDNKFSGRVFGRASASFGNSEASELRYADYCTFDPRHAELPAPDPRVRLRDLTESDRGWMESAFARRGQLLRLRAEDLAEGDLRFEQFSRHYAEAGLERRREFVVAEIDGVRRGFAIVQIATPGLCLSELTNSFCVHVDPGPDAAAIRRTLIVEATRRLLDAGMARAVCLNDEREAIAEYEACGFERHCEVAIFTAHRHVIRDSFSLTAELLAPAPVEQAPGIATRQSTSDTARGRYLLGESSGETRRLLRQAAGMDLRGILESTGLRPGMRVLDVGCGPGATTKAIVECLGDQPRVVGVDLSPARLATAVTAAPAARFVSGDILRLPFSDESFDFVFSQYVFEYLKEPDDALRELIRVTRRGGTVVVADIDGLAMQDHPMPESLRERLGRVLAVVERTGFDPFAGRKLFHRFVSAGLARIDVQLRPGYLIPGTAPQVEIDAWTQRLEALTPAGLAALGSPEAWAEFRTDYLAHLRDPASLKHASLFVVRGVRP